MTRAAESLRADFERREPRCRICRDETVRVLVNELLDWHGAPIILGCGKTHVVTYSDILRDLEPLNEGRDKSDRITYDSLWVHAKRHYDLARITAYWRARMHKELMNALGGITGVGPFDSHKQVPLSTKNSSPRWDLYFETAWCAIEPAWCQG